MFPHGRPLRRPWHAGAQPMFPYPLPPYGTAGPFPGHPRLPPPYASGPYFGGAAGAAVRHPAPPPYVHAVQLQSVTAVNYEAELDLIGALLPRYPYVVVDTEYPGTVHRPPAGTLDADLTPDELYALVKANVDELPIVQLGLTLCDALGNLPVIIDYATGHCAERAWEFNFADFDPTRHRHAPQSVAFLRSQGIDFDRARQCGVASAAFAGKLAGILSAAPRGDDDGERRLTWVAFGGAYDMAYLVKMLGGGQPLPETRGEFAARVAELLSGQVFDAKYMAENCGRGDLRDVGLRTVAANLGVPRPIVEPPCLAGPKSLTACRIYSVMTIHVLSKEDAARFEGIIDGLQ